MLHEHMNIDIITGRLVEIAEMQREMPWILLPKLKTWPSWLTLYLHRYMNMDSYIILPQLLMLFPIWIFFIPMQLEIVYYS